jgi:transglutaminase-like putative cysteine protease
MNVMRREKFGLVSPLNHWNRKAYISFCLAFSAMSILLVFYACSTSSAVLPPPHPSGQTSTFNRADFEHALAGRNLDVLASYSSKDSGSLGANLNSADREKAARRYEALRQELLLIPASQAALAPDLPSLAALLAKPEARHFTSFERAKLDSALARYAAVESPASKYRTGIVDPRISRITKTQLSNAARDPGHNLKAIVNALLSGESDPFLRIKLIHDWIADTVTYDVSMLSKNSVTGQQDLASVLASRRAVCSGYARLFEKMAELAGFEVKTVNGYTKGLGGDFAFDVRNSHAWNMVRIGDLWYFIDTTFDAGAFDSDGGSAQYHKRYSTDYLFPSPFQLRFTHFPDNALYQLSVTPTDKEDFKSRVLVSPEFFKNGLTVQRMPGATASLSSFAYLQKTSGLFSLDIEASEKMLVDASLFDAKGKELERYTFASHISPTSWRLIFAPPSTGRFKARIFAGPENPGNADSSPSILAGVLQFELEMSSAGSKASASARSANPPFPKIYGRYHEPAGELLESPLDGSLAKGSTTHFFYHSKSKYVSIIYDNTFVPLKRDADGSFSIDFKVPATSAIKLGVSEDNVRYSIVLAWDVR